jgi:Ca-activated chloride channel homolog
MHRVLRRFLPIVFIISLTTVFAVSKSNWSATSVNDAMQQLFGSSKARLDSRVILKAPKVAANGGSVSVYVSTTIDAKRVALFQDANPSALVVVWNVTKSTIPNFEIKIKMAQSGTLTAVVEGKDGKLYKAEQKVEIALGGCDGGGGESYYPTVSREIKKMHRSPMRTKSIQGSVRSNLHRIPQSRNEYKAIKENIFKETITSALSTFSVDVDTASYTQVRSRVMEAKVLPLKDMVRLEEMINYFNYDYKQPTSKEPFAINTRVGESLWNKNSKVIQVGLQTKKVDIEKLPASNLVFLLDVSGSMFAQNKLPLLIDSLKLLVKELREKDRVSIVVYAGRSGLVLDRARGDEKEKIYAALNALRAGGSTAGGAGIQLAYKTAKKSFIDKGNNRVILATDGDFNVGVRSESDLISLIEEKRKTGIFLSVLGFGNGNYKDKQMEALADKGNGNYNFIDTLLEAKKVLVTQMSGTLYTVAKDVKIQVEFNPSKVHSYRLIGYENRLMANEDFNNDKKDAGEVGMGHKVTALYEVVLVGDNSKSQVDTLKYQQANYSSLDELATVKIRYKKPDGNVSKLMSKVITLESSDISKEDFGFAQDVAAFGMMLRDAKYVKDLSYPTLIESAKDHKAKDRDGYRAEFIKMVETAQLIKSR